MQLGQCSLENVFGKNWEILLLKRKKYSYTLKIIIIIQIYTVSDFSFVKW
jgi:hypothetical protein